MILLDTCALLWLTQAPASLSQSARDAIRSAPEALAVSPISLWEIALKVRQGQLRFSTDLSMADWYRRTLSSYGLTELPLDAEILADSVALPLIHRDPCDRMLIAAALRHRMAIITADQIIPTYPGVSVIW